MRKLLAFMSLAGPRSGCRLPWRLPRGRSCAPESDSSGWVWGMAAQCPFWPLDQESDYLLGEAKGEAKDGRRQRTQSVDTKVPNTPRHTCFLGLSPLVLVLPQASGTSLGSHLSQPPTTASPRAPPSPLVMPLVGPEDHHNPRRPRQPEQRGTPSLVAVVVVFCAVHSPLFQWDSLRHKLAGRGLPAGAEERQGGQVQEELSRGAQMGPSRLQALQTPDGPAGWVAPVPGGLARSGSGFTGLP